MSEFFQFIMASFVIFLFGIGLILLFYFSTKKRRYIKRNGILTDAEIVGESAFYDPGSDKGMGREKTSYYITCKYVTKFNEEITKEFRDVSYRRHQRLKHPIGSKVKIFYLLDNPYQSIVKSSMLDIGLHFMLVLGISLLLFSAFVLYNGLVMLK